jgi:hypothetical protein
MRFSGRQLGAKKYKLRPWVEAMECRLAMSISLNINDTSAVTDDLTLYNPPTSAEPFVQTVPMEVVNKGPAATVKLVVVPAGAVTLSASSLTLQADGSAQVVITPASVSKAVGDITIEARVGPNNKLEGSRAMTDVSVIVPKKVRNSDTPPRMTANRIPPRVTTKLPVMVTPDLKTSRLTVAITANGQSQANGMLKIDGKSEAELTKSSDINLMGTAQTAATLGYGGGNAGNLTLSARVRGQGTVESDGFSVAAIPENWTISFDALIHYPGVLGFEVQDKWQSDSRDLADLDEAEISEQVQVHPGQATGTFAGLKSSNSGYIGANEFTTDIHTTPVALYLKDDGGMVTENQTSIFLDARTGARNIPVSRSGYTVTRKAFKNSAHRWALQTIKKGATATANGYESAAGAGGPIDKTQVV